ncbi:MAG: dATP/dGTP diphosphohydrolase domain-containing protein [Candidatus Dormibacteraceae bacterium]
MDTSTLLSANQSNDYHTLKKDAGKDRWDLLPTGAIRMIVRVLGFGAKKYAARSWMQVPEARDRYYAAALRHITAWWDGERYDPESGLHHLGHALCCLVFLYELDPKDDHAHTDIP